MIIISTHVHTLVHNYPPFSISTHVEFIIVLKTKDFVKTKEKFWIAVRLRRGAPKRYLSFCSFMSTADRHHLPKTCQMSNDTVKMTKFQMKKCQNDIVKKSNLSNEYLMKCLSSSGTLVTI